MSNSSSSIPAGSQRESALGRAFVKGNRGAWFKFVVGLDEVGWVAALLDAGMNEKRDSLLYIRTGHAMPQLKPSCFYVDIESCCRGQSTLY